MGDELLLRPEEQRYSLFPVRHEKAWQHYKTALAAFWVPGEVDLSEDPKHWAKLTAPEKHFLSHVLAFFATSDGIVCDNLADRFTREVTIREVKCFYDLQKTMENIHNEMYALLVQTLIVDREEQLRLFNAINDIPCVAKKAAWAQRWMVSAENFATRLVAFCIVEGVFFSGSFAAIFWIKKRGLMPGLCVSNTLIARDERMHQDFAAYLYKEMIHEKLSPSTVHTIMADAVAHEIEFICEAIPVSLIGMNAEDMSEYIKFVADRLLVQLGVSKIYDATNPFEWAVMQGMENKTNFFEQRVSEYQKVGAKTSNIDDHAFALDEDF